MQQRKKKKNLKEISHENKQKNNTQIQKEDRKREGRGQQRHTKKRKDDRSEKACPEYVGRGKHR